MTTTIQSVIDDIERDLVSLAETLDILRADPPGTPTLVSYYVGVRDANAWILDKLWKVEL